VARNRDILLAISGAVRAVQGARTLDEVYRSIGDKVAGLGWDVTVFEPAGDGEHLRLSHMTFDPAWLRVVKGLTGLSMLGLGCKVEQDGLLRQVIAEGKSVFCGQAAQPAADGISDPERPLIARLAAPLGVGRSIYAPLRLGGRVSGVLCVVSADLTPADVPAVNILANQADTAVEGVRLLDELAATRAQLRELAHRSISEREEERRRWARTLHDEAGQALTVLRIDLELMQQDLPARCGSLRQRMADAVVLTGATLEQIRLLAQDLHPPALDDLGLSLTLEVFCRDFSKRTGLVIEYHGLEAPALPLAVRVCLYRCLQEALTNVVKHACATQVRVALRGDAEMVSLSVEDDGRGFDLQTALPLSAWSTGIGLLGMQERLESLGGRLEIETRPSNGTSLAAHVPAGGTLCGQSQ
jgi:signal transduction histidine kinase